MGYKDLSDEEIVQAVKKAREYSEKNGTDLTIALRGALDVMVEERKKREEAILAENPLYVQAEPIVLPEKPVEQKENPYSDVVERKTFPFGFLDGYYRTNLTNATEFARVARRYAESVQNEDTKQCIEFAEKGILSKEIMTRALRVIPASLKPEFTEILAETNNLARENYYLYCTYTPDEALESDKKEAIYKYRELRKLAMERYIANSQNNLWGKGTPSTYEHERMWYEEWIDKRSVGVEVNKEGYFLEFDPLAYDQEYGYASEQITETGPRLSEEKFNKARGIISDKIIMLEKMTVEEYRQYKLTQMKLTPDEKELFEQHIEEYSKNNQRGRR